MTPVFLATPCKPDGQPLPIRMKTGQPGFFSYVGFPSRELGSYYLERRGHQKEDFTFVDMQPFYAATTIEDREGVEKVVFLKEKSVIDQLAQNPETFPYAAHEVLIVLLLPPPEDLLPRSEQDGFLSRISRWFK